MQTITQGLHATYARPYQPSIFSRIAAWFTSQERFRFAWLAVIIFAHGCFLTPVTVLTIVSTGNSILLFGIAMAAMGMSLVTNLAAMPTKITIPVFLLSIAIDIALICVSILGV